jgi:hypothetical protein
MILIVVAVMVLIIRQGFIHANALTLLVQQPQVFGCKFFTGSDATGRHKAFFLGSPCFLA